MNAKPRLSVSTWSLHRTLGRMPGYGPGTEKPAYKPSDDALPLIELPARLAAFGINTFEICHFHLPTTSVDYLTQLRAAIEEAGVELWSLLIDGGDIADPVHAERDLRWTEEWIDVAVALGAKNARVAAGRQAPTDDALARSYSGFQRLSAYGAERGIRITTENWLETFSTPDALLSTMEKLDGKVGLCFDFGNWTGPEKYDQLAHIVHLSESCHTKANFTSATEMDRDDYVCCLDMTKAANFSGPYTLIYDGPNDDEWWGLRREMDVVTSYT